MLYNKVDERVINLLYKKVQLEYCREEEENREKDKKRRQGNWCCYAHVIMAKYVRTV